MLENAAADIRKDYAHALLECASKRSFLAACPIAFGEVSVKERVKTTMSYKKPFLWVMILCIILCALVAVLFCTSPADTEGNSSQETSTESVQSTESVLETLSEEQSVPTEESDASENLSGDTSSVEISDDPPPEESDPTPPEEIDPTLEGVFDVIYYKENSVYLYSSQTGKNHLLTNSFKNYSASHMAEDTVISADRKYVLFPGERSADSFHAPLYCRIFDGTEHTTITITESYNSYFLANDSRTLYYRERGGALYRYDLAAQTATLLNAHAGDNYYCSPDGKSILYAEFDEDINYTWFRICNGGPVENLSCMDLFDMSYEIIIRAWTEDFSTVYYTYRTYVGLGENFYKIDKDRVVTKISDSCDPNSIRPIGGDDFYFLEVHGRSYDDFVENDMGAEGEALLERISHFASQVGTLYLYRNGQAYALAENVLEKKLTFGETKATGVCGTFDVTNKIKLSSLKPLIKKESAFWINYAMECHLNWTYFADDQAFPIDVQNVYKVSLADDASALALFSAWDPEELYGDVSVVKLNDSGPGTVMSTGDRARFVYFCGGEIIYHTTEHLKQWGLAEPLGPAGSHITYWEPTGAMTYTSSSTLYFLNGIICKSFENAHSPIVFENGTLLFVKNGHLQYFDGAEIKTVADGVLGQPMLLQNYGFAHVHKDHE